MGELEDGGPRFFGLAVAQANIDQAVDGHHFWRKPELDESSREGEALPIEDLGQVFRGGVLLEEPADGHVGVKGAGGYGGCGHAFGESGF